MLIFNIVLFINKYAILDILDSWAGLWEVVSNDEAVQFVCEYLYSQMEIYLKSSISRRSDNESFNNDNSSKDTEQSMLLTSRFLPTDAIHNAARELSLEAYVRGSSDNIGVCIIEIN